MEKQNTRVVSSSHISDASTRASVFPLKRISWSSVFAGALVALVVQVALTILGIGIGLSTVDVTEEANPTSGLGVGSAIWYGVSSLLALFAGGWVAGRLAQSPRIFDGILHGILTWCLITIASLYFLTTTISSLVGGVGRLVGNTLSTVGNVAGQGISAVAPEIKNSVQRQIEQADISVSDIKREAKTLLQQTGKEELQPGNLREEANAAQRDARDAAGNIATNPNQDMDGVIDRLFQRGQNITEEVDREAVVNVIVARTGKSRAEAEQIADNWINKFNTAKAEVGETKQAIQQNMAKGADAAADAISTAAIIGFFSMLLGALAAGFGAHTGTLSKADAALAPAV